MFSPEGVLKAELFHMDVMVPIQNPVTTLSFFYHLDGKNISPRFKVNCDLSGLGNETVTLGPLVLLATRLVWTFNKTQSSSRLGSEVRLPSAAAVSLQGNFIGTGHRKGFCFLSLQMESLALLSVLFALELLLLLCVLFL